jgi:hypothetical protein
MTLMTREAEDDLTEPSLQGDPDNRQFLPGLVAIIDRRQSSLANNVLAVSSEPIGRTQQSINKPISGHAETGDGLFRGAWQLARASTAAGLRLDRPAGASAGGIPRLYRRVLDADNRFARRRPARAHTAQGEARRTGACQSLRSMTYAKRRVQ